jgi:Asp-tRNA(Asn)/Glu-tRNA(Gln) amidotransferase A subunit family amidase
VEAIMEKSGSSRRALLKGTAFATLSAGLAGCVPSEEADAGAAGQSEAPDTGRISTDTIAHAERLFDVSYTDAEREQIVTGIDDYVRMATRLRLVEKPNSLAPACVFDPRLPGRTYRVEEDNFQPSNDEPGTLPGDDASIAFAPVWKLSAWLARGDISSRRLTEIYLDRIARFDLELSCFVTVTAEIARAEADRCDAELAAGHNRGPLHGIPYGMKDIIDVANVPSTWGATPFKDRVAEDDARVTVMLREAGAVLLGKTTAGAIAYGERWFDGITRNPWNTEEGSSGSSAGSGSATGAGLVGFGIGTETLGSIVSPANRCGTAGLRPTFGRVSRHGAMALCWSLDKIGALTRSVEDTAFVLQAINGHDAQDPGSIETGFDVDLNASVAGMRVGWSPAWFENASDADRAALDAARAAGVELVEVTLPDLPYGSLLISLYAESAAAFEELTLSDADDSMVWQEPNAWPNTWRSSRFLSAVDLVNSDRLRRQVMEVMDDVFSGVDAMIGPNFAAGLLVITNYTGHPQLAFRSGFTERETRSMSGENASDTAPHRVPQTTSLWAPLFEDGRIITLGREIERRLAVADERPANFD